MQMRLFLITCCALLTISKCADFSRKKRLCGRNLMLHIKNICEHTQCSESLLEDRPLETSSSPRINSRNRYTALPYECCTRGCSILTIQQHCCGNHSIVKTDTSTDLDTVDTSYNEYTMNPSTEDEMNRQQQKMNAAVEAVAKNRQSSRHRRRHHHHHHTHNTQLPARNIYQDLYMTPVFDEKLQELRKKLHQNKKLNDLLEF